MSTFTEEPNLWKRLESAFLNIITRDNIMTPFDSVKSFVDIHRNSNGFQDKGMSLKHKKLKFNTHYLPTYLPSTYLRSGGRMSCVPPLAICRQTVMRFSVKAAAAVVL